MKKFLKISATTIISLIIFLIISEIYLRYKGLGNPIIYKKDLNFGYLPYENQQVSRFKDSKITINNNNFRVFEENNYINKIYFLGDSITYGGSYIDDKNLFSSKVCLNLNLNYSIRFDCLNGGVNAYGFENIIKRLKFLNYNKNDFIVVTLILGNFYRNFIQIESLPYFTKTNDHLFKANIELLSFLIDKIRNKLRFKSNFRNFEKKENLDILKIKIKNDFNLLKEFLDNNSNILIFFSPSKNFYENKNEFIMEKHLFDTYKNNTNIFALNDFVKNKEYKKIFYDNIHLNNYGHKIYSDIISNIIIEKIKE